MLELAHRETLVARLNRIEGQLRGIRRMIEAPRPCIDLLQQLSAAEAALARISHSVFKFHVEHCVPDGVSKGKVEQHKQLRELVDIFDRRAR
jgi:CsoR family transcriptional regulator, copper-sensing transcriptional repressor